MKVTSTELLYYRLALSYNEGMNDRIVMLGDLHHHAHQLQSLEMGGLAFDALAPGD